MFGLAIFASSPLWELPDTTSEGIFENLQSNLYAIFRAAPRLTKRLEEAFLF